MEKQIGSGTRHQPGWSTLTLQLETSFLSTHHTDRRIKWKLVFEQTTSLPYFRVKLSCVMFAYKKKVMTFSDPMVTCSHPKLPIVSLR